MFWTEFVIKPTSLRMNLKQSDRVPNASHLILHDHKSSVNQNQGIVQMCIRDRYLTAELLTALCWMRHFSNYQQQIITKSFVRTSKGLIQYEAINGLAMTYEVSIACLTPCVCVF